MHLPHWARVDLLGCRSRKTNRVFTYFEIGRAMPDHMVGPCLIVMTCQPLHHIVSGNARSSSPMHALPGAILAQASSLQCSTAVGRVAEKGGGRSQR